MPLVTTALVAMASAQAIGGSRNAEAMRRQAKIQQQIAELNAQYMEIDAFRAEAAGITRANRYSTMVTRTIADQRLAMAASNVDMTSGTAKAIQTESKAIGDLNMIDIIEQGQMQAYGLRMQALNTRSQSQFNREAAMANADATAEGGFISGVSTFASGYLKGKA